jgi:hypothetical protein
MSAMRCCSAARLLLAFGGGAVVHGGEVRGEGGGPVRSEHPLGVEPGDRVQVGVFA